MLPLLFLLGCGLELSVDTTEGPLPLTVHFEVEGYQADAARWDFGDGNTAQGRAVSHTWLASGLHTVSVTLEGDDTLVASTQIAVQPADCPEVGEGETIGTVSDTVIDEASGLVDSHINPGVIWTHNDSGDSPRLFGVDHSGELLTVVSLTDVSPGDWEDLALGSEPNDGTSWLIVGDIGDNSHVRDSVYLRIVEEPTTGSGQEFQDLEVTSTTLDLTYPDGEMLNSEALLFDPVTQDILLVTKDYGGEARIYRKPSPHLPDTTTELELVATLDFSQPPLSGGATTAADFSPLGDQIVIRTYGSTAYIFRRDQAESLASAFSSEPCPVQLITEPQGETITFAADGQGLYTLSEGVGQSIYFIPLTP